MRTLRTTAIAGALVFFELLVPKAMAAELKPLDKKSDCKKWGDLWGCFKVPDGYAFVFTNEQMEAIEKTTKPTMEQIEAAKPAAKKDLEAK